VFVPAKIALVPISHRGALATYALCDPEDQEMLLGFRWRMTSRGYATAYVHHADVLMHRLLLGMEKVTGIKEADHINRCKLDNRRSNLRLVSVLENKQNHPGFGGSSEFRGVFKTRAGTFEAKARVNGRLCHVGTFRTERGAAEAVEAYRLKHMPGARPELDLAPPGQEAAA
jgi:HNH endonuclease